MGHFVIIRKTHTVGFIAIHSSFHSNLSPMKPAEMNKHDWTENMFSDRVHAPQTLMITLGSLRTSNMQIKLLSEAELGLRREKTQLIQFTTIIQNICIFSCEKVYALIILRNVALNCFLTRSKVSLKSQTLNQAVSSASKIGTWI